MTARTKQNQCAIATAGIIEEISEIGFPITKGSSSETAMGFAADIMISSFLDKRKAPDIIIVQIWHKYTEK